MTNHDKGSSEDSPRSGEVVGDESTLDKCIELIRAGAGNTALGIFLMGEGLEQARSLLSTDKKWETWVRENFPHLTVRTANRYRRVHVVFREHKSLLTKFQISALHALATNDAPPRAKEVALSDAKTGMFVTASHARTLIRNYGDKTPSKVKTKRRKRTVLTVDAGKITVDCDQSDLQKALQQALAQLPASGADGPAHQS